MDPLSAGPAEARAPPGRAPPGARRLVVQRVPGGADRVLHGGEARRDAAAAGVADPVRGLRGLGTRVGIGPRSGRAVAVLETPARRELAASQPAARSQA